MATLAMTLFPEITLMLHMKTPDKYTMLHSKVPQRSFRRFKYFGCYSRIDW